MIDPVGEADASQSSPDLVWPALGDHCTSDRALPWNRVSDTPRGEIRKLGDIDIYLTKPEEEPEDPSKLLLLLTGGTGFKSTNYQLQADQFADDGFVVIMPDLFGGDPAPNLTAIVESEIPAASLLDKVKLKAFEAAKSFLVDMWLARHTDDKILPILDKVIEASLGEFADVIENGGGIYAAGYCIGGRYVFLLASERTRYYPSWAGAKKKQPDEEAGELPKIGPAIKAGAIAHAALVSPYDFENIKSPLTVAGVKNDPMFPDDVFEAGEEIMRKSGIRHQIVVYEGVPHGFAVVGEYDDYNIKDEQRTAYLQMSMWLKEH
ncbi:alpha/beta-hydrolase [Nemania sp. FL0031]|nr:alpha/beta-hydrolase [Nemania sp. FL0031]